MLKCMYCAYKECPWNVLCPVFNIYHNLQPLPSCPPTVVRELPSVLPQGVRKQPTELISLRVRPKEEERLPLFAVSFELNRR